MPARHFTLGNQKVITFSRFLYSLFITFSRFLPAPGLSAVAQKGRESIFRLPSSLFFPVFFFYPFSMWIAFFGHPSAQTAQPMHFSLSTFQTSSFRFTSSAS